MTAWYRRIRLTILGAWSLIGVWAGAQWRTPNGAERIPAATVSGQIRQPARTDSSRALLDEILARMPFHNADALQLQSESRPAPTDTPASQTLAVQLTLSGVVDGRVQQAIIDGLPGTEGSRTLRIGERVGNARLLEVTAHRAVVDISGARVELPLGKPIRLNQ